MTWFILLGLLLLASIYTIVPLLTPSLKGDSDELERIKRQITEVSLVKSDDDAQIHKETAIQELEARALEILQKQKSPSTLPRHVSLFAPGLLIIGTITLYALIGSPNF